MRIDYCQEVVQPSRMDQGPSHEREEWDLVIMSTADKGMAKPDNDRRHT
jgi:hypothetical protein